MTFYRYVDYVRYNSIDLVLLEYEMERETPKGYWINVNTYPKWVSKTSRKRYAFPTKEQAFASFQARKSSQISHLSSQLKRANSASLLTPDNSKLYYSQFTPEVF